jgi:hypothetical protein
MTENECDQDSEYRRQRIAAAREVELWIQDGRVLDVFRERIRFAKECWDEFDRECSTANEEEKRLVQEDWAAAKGDRRLRNKDAGPPGSEYEWHHFTSYHVQNRPTKEDFEDLCAGGLDGTWEEVKEAWRQKRWGYWGRKAPAVTKTGLPWLLGEWHKGEYRIFPARTPREALQRYYAFLTAIHDGDLQGVALISQGIWPEIVLKDAYRNLCGYHGDKSDLIQTALKTVRQDVDSASDRVMPTGEWSKPMSKARMMRALGIDSRASFRAWLKDKEVRPAGNRQTWSIRLDTLDQRSRGKLDKA